MALERVRDVIRKYAFRVAVVVVILMGAYIFYMKRTYENKIVDLHNEIAASSKTIEIKEGLYKKATSQAEDLENALKALEKQAGLDKETITALRKEIEKNKEEILAVSNVAAKWKKKYEAEATAHQEDQPPVDPDNPDQVVRTKVTFDKDFGYIKVDGFTLTNPAYAWVAVEQTRPLVLTIALTQSKDGRWNTYVASSEKDVGIDVKLSSVNPYMFSEKWYEKISVDVGMDLKNGLYPYAGLSYPIGPVSLSAGVWGNDTDVGYYSTINYSWLPFSRTR